MYTEFKTEAKIHDNIITNLNISLLQPMINSRGGPVDGMPEHHQNATPPPLIFKFLHMVMIKECNLASIHLMG